MKLAKLSLLISALFFATSAYSDSEQNFDVAEIATFHEPWSMTFMPNGSLLVAEKYGKLSVVSQAGEVSRAISGVPDVDYGGQGGLGDVVLHPDFADNNLVYISYAEAGVGDTRGAAVARAELSFDARGRGSLNNLEVIWRQYPKVAGRGHYGHRIIFDKDGYLFIASGERQKFFPAQDMQSNMGKILRLNDDGSIPEDNPFYGRDTVTSQIWSLGHRNPLGFDFDQQGRLWNAEMGPRFGDEVNLVKRGADYGYPTVSDGDHYSGEEIPDHSTRPEFEAPKVVWTDTTVAPAEMIFYTGEVFEEWQNSALIAGLANRSIVRLDIDGDSASVAEVIEMGARIRELEQGPNGALWVLEDGKDARLLKLTPKAE